MFDPPDHLSIMTEAPLKKRDHESKALLDSIDVWEPKCFHGEKTDRFLHLLQLDQTLADDDDEEFAPNEELVNGVMKRLEEEILATCCTSYPSSNSGDNFAGPEICSRYEGQTRDSDSGIDLCYLLEASDDELGIPPSPVLDLKEVCQSSKETSESLWENRDLKSLGENWHFENDFEDYQRKKYSSAQDVGLFTNKNVGFEAKVWMSKLVEKVVSKFEL